MSSRLAPPDRSRSRRFNLGPDSGGCAGRFGGTTPDGLKVSLRDTAEYIMTFPLTTEPELMASVFRNCSFDEFLDAMNDGFKDDDRIVVVPHSTRLPRSRSKRFQSAVSPHGIVVGDEISDRVASHPLRPSVAPVADVADVADVDAQPYSGHKFGGEPYCLQEPELPGSRELFEAGFVQVIQVDFPGPEDGEVDGDWPFMDGLFNLFGRPPFIDAPWYWYLQK